MRNTVDHDPKVCRVDAYGNLLPQGKKKRVFKLKKAVKPIRDCGKVDIGFRGILAGINTNIDRDHVGNFAP